MKVNSYVILAKAQLPSPQLPTN